MSELKVCHCNEWHNEYTEFYLKSEADKVIAEKNAEIAELKEQIEVLKHQACKMNCMMVKHYNEVCDDNVHHKYKRCLGIAKWCFEKSYSTTLVKYDKKSGLLRNFYDWWGYHWLELAEKFKEAKQ